MKNKNKSICGRVKSLINRVLGKGKDSRRDRRTISLERKINSTPAPPQLPKPDTPAPEQSNLTWAGGYQLNNGDYIIEKEIGRGGFGITYLALDRTGKRVVIKTLIKQEEVQSREVWAEFWENLSNEAVQLAQCSGRNPHIVKLHRIMRAGELPCMVMEYIEGKTLSEMVRDGVLPEDKALLYIGQIGGALIEIHERGMLHRDVKPHNVMIRKDGKGAVLIDFGIAKKFVSGVTQTFLPALTPGYAPIEQYEWRSRQDTYTDVYALAATLYFALTGKKPASAESRVTGTVLEPPNQLNPNISDKVNKAIIHGLHLEGRDRPRTIQLFLKELLPDQIDIKTLNLPPERAPRNVNYELEYPEGPVGVNSSFYIKRPELDSYCDEIILQSGALIRIKAPKLMGKTSLINRILDVATMDLHAKTVQLNFLEVDEEVLVNINKFLQWFCAKTARDLKLPHELNERWDDFLSSTSNCTSYFEEYILPSIHSPLVLSLDEIDRIFPYEKIAGDFFALLRLWHEKGKSNSGWKQLRLIVAHSSEVYIKLKTTQSPFNVGILVELPEFTSSQVQDLARRHQLDWDDTQVEKFMAMVGGHPYLVRRGIYFIAREKLSESEFLSKSSTSEGIYKDHLRRLSWSLQQEPELGEAFMKVVKTSVGVELENSYKQRLLRMGLIKLQGNLAVPRCNLYAQFFAQKSLVSPPLGGV